MYLKLCLRINSETEYGSNRTNQVIDQVTAILQNKYLIIYTYTLFNIIFLLTCYKCQNGSVTAGDVWLVEDGIWRSLSGKAVCSVGDPCIQDFKPFFSC